MRYLAFAGAAAFALFASLIGRDRSKPGAIAPGLSRSQARIASLDPSLRPLALALLETAWQDGIALVVVGGLRTLAEQQALYDRGRTTPGPIVTNAKPGSSWHNYGLAFDVAILAGGAATYPNDAYLWDRVGDAGRRVGLQWGGDFVSFKDRPHFEHHPGITLAQAANGARPSV